MAHTMPRSGYVPTLATTSCMGQREPKMAAAVTLAGGTQELTGRAKEKTGKARAKSHEGSGCATTATEATADAATRADEDASRARSQPSGGGKGLPRRR